MKNYSAGQNCDGGAPHSLEMPSKGLVPFVFCTLGGNAHTRESLFGLLRAFCWFYCCSCCFWSCPVHCLVFLSFFLDIRESHIRKENVSPVFVLPLVFPSVYACEETCSLRWTPYSVCLNWTPSTTRWLDEVGRRKGEKKKVYDDERIKHLEYLLKSFVSSLVFTQKTSGPLSLFFLSFPFLVF